MNAGAAEIHFSEPPLFAAEAQTGRPKNRSCLSRYFPVSFRCIGNTLRNAPLNSSCTCCKA